MKRTLTFVAAAVFSVSALADGSSTATRSGYTVGGNSNKSIARPAAKGGKRATTQNRNRSILDIIGFTEILDRVVEPEGSTVVR